MQVSMISVKVYAVKLDAFLQSTLAWWEIVQQH
jgi:hypothetical protein